jgi:predicted NBD/HSP70 family sugar kinase
MVSHAIVAIGQDKKTLIARLVNDEVDKITPEIIFQAAGKKDKLARDIIEEAGQYLGIAIANVTNSFDPEAIILGGEIAQFDNFNLMLESAKKAAIRHTFGGRARKTRILITELGGNSSAIGAASLVLERLFNPLSL